MKALIKQIFPRLVSWRNRFINYLFHYRFKNKPVAEVFETIYLNNHWKDRESISGTGSNLTNTETTRAIMAQVIESLAIKSLLDIPCGDFNWMKHVNLDGVKYVGADIVELLIQENQKKFQKDNQSFVVQDLLESKLPVADLLLTRDCLVHFSYSDIWKAIKNVKKSGCTYWMTTTFPTHSNYDIITGDWRPINLQTTPFNLPRPLLLFNEKCAEDDRYTDKSLAVWKMVDL